MKKLTTTASRRYISRSAYECVMYARRICQLQYRGFILDSDSSSAFFFLFRYFTISHLYSEFYAVHNRHRSIIQAAKRTKTKRYLINNAL